jgi:hypothetical protein
MTAPGLIGNDPTAVSLSDDRAKANVLRSKAKSGIIRRAFFHVLSATVTSATSTPLSIARQFWMPRTALCT